MGLTYVKVIIAHPTDWEKQKEMELLVDTGAVLSVIPCETLEKLGITPVGKQRFKIFGGGSVERSVGGILIRYNTTSAIVPTAFGEKGDTSILGTTALEALGYEVDPVTKQLKAVELLLL
ncbi:MAG: hypothetical protein AB1393_14035 [Candidatus Edwardsbacteria bacterium]